LSLIADQKLAQEITNYSITIWQNPMGFTDGKYAGKHSSNTE